jgi:methionyl-tRNA formyltransferase
VRVLFLGSGPFAVPALETLVRLSNVHPLVAVISRPDRPVGRRRQPCPTPVKARALELGVPCESPETLRNAEVLDRVRSFTVDLCIVADYGELLRESFLTIPRIGTFNLHGSLLPEFRGAAPVQHALLAGATETGVTLFRVERGLDSGPIVARARIDIGPEETAEELEARLSIEAARLLEAALPHFASGTFTETPQEHSRATLAPKLTKDSGVIDWRRSPESIRNQVRALRPWPTAHSTLTRDGEPDRRIIFLRVRRSGDGPRMGTPGEVIAVSKHGFTVACGGGAVDVIDVQPEGRAAMSSAAFLNGCPLRIGDRFARRSSDPGEEIDR